MYTHMFFPHRQEVLHSIALLIYFILIRLCLSAVIEIRHIFSLGSYAKMRPIT